ncbi:peptidylprolyl isomerase [Liquorilactobacillus nagelii]|jgi:peptidyl-prolyl cis-trans isomerase B (cyclophilin B)|uniref:peptidylprolyl isomerase n=1 Tax=Liquorilactobacillus nagelii TaxID=82688 RepID=UPI0006F09BA9|nr:peptidylprolyl isomerase [Liquorilactobacillus nagelii]KRL42505.1 peptidyl-prolyl cis-trans isomerase [Liquorilactobacillus nagelii DSM 13675]QYH53348.1 peptidylprolyl isomerase [Liquorilactobacillus nagelii DSM 13675]
MYPQINKTESTSSLAKIVTNFGEILVELFPEYAPKTVENFTKLSMKGYYDGTIFHRVIKDFMIQGGDPTGTGMGGQSIWQQSFEDEFSNELFNLRGALSMANAGPNTNGSQFFIVQNQNLPSQMEEQLRQANYPQEIIQAYLKGGTPWLDHHHTVFGQVRSGMDVIDEIANLQTENDHPIKEVAIKKISISNK